ncbi:hypothetical protein TA3x_000140 [Tundrisphaera sp. TA3]|uniref:hypothetical protein n=1 Tax=Tundrisphaera sp. TA3 TaxID=3435775 RepID=UPI003EBEEFB4
MITRNPNPGRRRLAKGVALLAALGCGGPADEYPREPISGTVTLDGQPLASGLITFEPTAGQPTQAGGMISAGEFSVPQDQGPVPGAYSVSIFAGSPDPGLAASAKDAGPPAVGGPRSKLRDPIPERYNIRTKLAAEVKAGGPNRFPFALESK